MLVGSLDGWMVGSMAALSWDFFFFENVQFDNVMCAYDDDDDGNDDENDFNNVDKRWSVVVVC